MSGKVGRAVLVLGVVAMGVGVAILPGAGGAQGSEGGEPKTFPARVSSDQAHDLVKKGALLLDVRTPAEYASGHVPGAVNVPFDELAARQAELGAKDRPVVLYCRSGRRTGIGARTLQDLGFSKVFDLGPMSRW